MAKEFVIGIGYHTPSFLLTILLHYETICTLRDNYIQKHATSVSSAFFQPFSLPGSEELIKPTTIPGSSWGASNLSAQKWNKWGWSLCGVIVIHNSFVSACCPKRFIYSIVLRLLGGYVFFLSDGSSFLWGAELKRLREGSDDLNVVVIERFVFLLIMSPIVATILHNLVNRIQMKPGMIRC